METFDDNKTIYTKTDALKLNWPTNVLLMVRYYRRLVRVCNVTQSQLYNNMSNFKLHSKAEHMCTKRTMELV